MIEERRTAVKHESSQRVFVGERRLAPEVDVEVPGSGSRSADAAAAANGSVPDVVLMIRPDGTVAFANRAVGGVPADEVLGRSVYEYVAEPARDAVRAQLREVFTNQRPGGCDFRGLGPAGVNRWYECRFSPNLREGQVVTATAVIRDVTARRAREAEVEAERESLRRRVEEMVVELAAAKVERKSGEVLERSLDERLAQFRALLDEAGEAIFLTDSATGQVVDVNETACRWLRVGREAVIGRTPEELGLEFPVLVPGEDEPAFTDTRGADRPLVLGGGRHRRQDRSTFPVEVSLTQHQYAGRQFVLAMVRDMKDRERAAEELRDTDRVYRSLFEWSGDAIFLTTRDGALLDANTAALTLFGYDRAGFLQLSARELYVDPDDIRRFRDAVSTAGMVRDLELSLKRSDGATFQARLSAMPRRRGDDSIRGYQCLVRPIVPAARDSGAMRASGAYPQGAILIVDGNEGGREEARLAFAKAGMKPLVAAALPEAAELVARPGPPVRAVLLDAAVAEGGAAAFVEALRRRTPAPVVLLADADRGSPLERESWVAVVVQRPAHPLALLQTVWETLAQQ